MKRKELLGVPARKRNETLHGVSGVYVIPNKRKHESGWGCMDFVAEFKDNRPAVRFGGGCDSVDFRGTNFRMDLDFESRLVHIWNFIPFSITADLPSIYFVEESEQ